MRRPSSRPAPRSSSRTRETAPATSRPLPSAPTPIAPHSSLGGKLVGLLLIVLVVFVAVFTPLRTWLNQREQAQTLAAQVAAAKAENARLEEELKKWQDPEYIARQARSRLGYVRPGETTFVVLEEDHSDDVKTENGTITPAAGGPWFLSAVQSIELASTAQTSTQDKDKK